MSLIDDQRAAFLSGPNSVTLATQDGQLRPSCTRALGLRCHAEGDLVTVWLAAAVAGRIAENLAVEPRIAVGVNRASTHQTFQLKGRAVAVRPAPPEREAEYAGHFRALVGEVAQVGLPRRLLEPVVLWPALEIDIEVSEIFDQTPGPGAGERCPP